MCTLGELAAMKFRAEVKCYLCGFLSGEVESDTSSPLSLLAFRPAGADQPIPVMRTDLLRCARCHGPTFLDEVTVVRQRTVLTPTLTAADFEESSLPKRRRGRPRKVVA